MKCKKRRLLEATAEKFLAILSERSTIFGESIVCFSEIIRANVQYECG